MKINRRLVLILFFVIAVFGLNLSPIQAQPVDTPNAYDVVAAVNALRASKGLSALQMDGSLMAAAQSQSDYQATIGTWTHSGADGSSPTVRAAAAGYGGGAKIFITENVAYLASSATINTLIYSIWSDSVHWDTMINSYATDCGAGVTETKGNVYYTLDVGYIAGRPASNNGTPFPTALPGTAVTSTSEAAGGDTATPSRVEPVQTASPQADGKVVHVVQQGQALWSIAIAYGVKIVDLAALNGLSATQPVVYVGQKLVIHPAFTPTTSPTVTDTPAPPTRTLAPSSTQSPPTMTFTPGSTRTQTPLPLLPKLPSLGSNQRQSIGIILVVVCGLGLAGVLVSRFLKKKP